MLAARRIFDKSVINEVTSALNEILREGVIKEANDNICLVSNLLPVAKPTSTYCLKSKIDKSLQVNAKKNLNRTHVTLDVRILNGYID